MLKFKLVGRNIKILGQGFNPGSINEYFLKEKKIILKDLTIKSNSIFTQQFTQINTKKFSLVCLPDQIQYNIINDEEFGVKFVGSFVKKVTSVKYTAIGINFDYFINLENDQIHNISRDLFFNESNPLFKEFDSPSAKFGSFLSKPFSSSVLNLTVKPIKATDPNGIEKEILHYSFNYHMDVNSIKTIETINKALRYFNKYFDYSKLVMSKHSKK